MPVREYRGEDFAAVCRVYLDAKHDELAFEDAGLPVTPMDEDPVILAAFRESTVLVFEDGQVVAFAATCGRQLRALFVHRAARRQGAGSALLRAVVDSAGPVTANVAKSNVVATRFYERHGFVVEGEFARPYGGAEIAYQAMTGPVHRQVSGHAAGTGHA